MIVSFIVILGLDTFYCNTLIILNLYAITKVRLKEILNIRGSFNN